MKDVMTKGRSLAKRATATYASYKATEKMVQAAIDAYAHVWTVDEDYLPYLHESACVLINETKVAMPWQRTKVEEHRTQREDADAIYRDTEWVLLNVAGTSRTVQARRQGDAIEFRSMRSKDLAVVKQRVEEIKDEREAALPQIDFDIRPSRTDIFAWNGKTDEWDYRKARTSRSFTSVVLPAELQGTIEADLKSFTDSRERLQRLELPWRRGYLLEGPPGTGKTSLSLAIAGTLGFSLASLSLTDIKSDGMLKQAVSSLRSHTVLVIEDIDAYSVSRDRDHNSQTNGDLSLSGLLNSLDGFETPDGLITICTTNHIEQLDPALIRPGRLDRIFTLDYIEGPEFIRLFEWFYETTPKDLGIGLLLEQDCAFAEARIAPAEVSELFKQHLDDPAAGWAAAMERLTASQRPELKVA